MDNAAFPGVVMGLPIPLVLQPRAAPICRSGDGRFPFASADNLNVAMINCVASLLPHLGQNAQHSLGPQPYLFEKQARFPRRDLRRTPHRPTGDV
jgi:hypothetical protein